MECRICASLAGDKKLAPVAIIAVGKYWQVEHAYSTAVKGWLRVVLRRHAQALHELTSPEFSELKTLLQSLTQALVHSLKCEKEYIMCFSEGEGTRHLHIHVVGKPYDLPPTAGGANIFSLLNVPPPEGLTKATIRRVATRLTKELERAKKK